MTATVDVSVPLATTPLAGTAAAPESAALIVAGSPTKPTVGCVVNTTGVPSGSTVTVITLVSATVDAIVAVAMPEALVGPAGCVSVLPAPVDAISTV